MKTKLALILLCWLVLFGAAQAVQDESFKKVINRNTVTFGSASDFISDIISDFWLDTSVPTISITSPVEGSDATAGPIAVTGAVSGTGSVPNVVVNGVAAKVILISDDSGTYDATVSLAVGLNTINAIVTDEAENTASVSIAVNGILRGGDGSGIGEDLRIISSSVSEETVGGDGSPMVSEGVTISDGEAEFKSEEPSAQAPLSGYLGFMVILFATGTVMSGLFLWMMRLRH